MLSSLLPWVCVEVKFEGLFMGFSSEERGEEEEKVTGEERGKEEEKERKEREREREREREKCSKKREKVCFDVSC